MNKKRLIAQCHTIIDSDEIITVSSSMKILFNKKLNRNMLDCHDYADYGKYVFVINGHNGITYYYIECYQISNENSLLLYCIRHENDNNWSEIYDETKQIKARQFKSLKDIIINGKEIHLTTATTFEELRKEAVRE